MRPNNRLQPFACTVLACLLFACSEGSSSQSKNVLLVTLDTTRWDAVGALGGNTDITPHLDGLAREGLLYERAYSTAPLTLPAHASLMTGLYPIRHTIRENGLKPLPDSAVTVAELAREAGVETGAFVAAMVLHESFGIDQGFEAYDAPAVPLTPVDIAERSAYEVIDLAQQWLKKRDRERPFFLWVHLFDPHGPYVPPSQFGDVSDDPYLGEVAAMDDAIGLLFQYMQNNGHWDDTLVIAVSDHGEAFGEKGESSHGIFCYEETMKIPLIIRYPDGYRGGERADEIVSLVDLFPTLCEALDVETPPGVDGESLFRRSPELSGRYFESYSGFINLGTTPLSGWVDERGKYVHGGQPEFFDLGQDPGETVNLAADRVDALRDYRRAIAEIAERSVLQDSAADGLDSKVLDGVRGLGYAAVGEASEEMPHPLARMDRPSPHEMVEPYQNLLQAMVLIQGRQYGEALQLLGPIVAEFPFCYQALDRLAFCLFEQERYEDALRAFSDMLRLKPNMPTSHYYRGYCLFELKRIDEAIEALKQAVSLKPDDPEFILPLAQILIGEGRVEEAEPYRRRLAELQAAQQQQGQ